MKVVPGGGSRRPGMLSFRAMRHSIALIALLALFSAGIPDLGRSASSMACCQGGAAMACCLPASGCAMKTCPPARWDAALPGLPPATLVDAPAAMAPESTAEKTSSRQTRALTFPSHPPEQPPRA